MIVPVVLAGATLWARQKAWQKLEEDFRQQLISSAKAGQRLNSRSSFDILLWREKKDVYDYIGGYKTDELPALVSSVRLAVNKDNEGEMRSKNYLHCQVDHGSASLARGFTLGIELDEGFIVSGSSPNGMVENKWWGFKLAPESCRALKKQIWRDFGPKLRELHVPPPR